MKSVCIFDTLQSMLPTGWLVRVLFASTICGALVTQFPLAVPSAAAQDDEDDDWDDEDEDEDEDEGEEDEYEDEEEEEEEADEQPPVTAGGLYTRKTYPRSETLRPLTMTKGILEVRAGFDMDLSALDAFETWRIPLSAKYGLRDHVELQAGVDFLLATTDEKRQEFEEFGSLLPPLDAAVLSVGMESALYYDVVDFKIGLDFPINPGAPGNEAPDCETVDETVPCGLTPPVPFTFDIVVGFPFRYAPKKQFAIVGLDKLFTVHTIGGGKPDLTASLGALFQPLEPLAIFLRAEFIVPEFNTNFLLIPAIAQVQFSPNNRLDLGLQFSFANIKPTSIDEANDIGPFDRRFLLLYVQTRL